MIQSRWSAVLIACVFALHSTPSRAAPQGEGDGALHAAVPGRAQDESRIDQALQTLKKDAVQGQIPEGDRDALITAIGEGFGGLAGCTPDCHTIRSRLESAVKDICSRAKKSTISPAEFDALRADISDAGMREAISNAKGKSGEESKEALSTALKGLVAAADALDPATSELRERGKTLIEGLASKPSLAPADLSPLARQVSRSAMLRAEAILESRAASKQGASATDFARVRDQVLDHAALVAPADEGKIRDELTGLLDGLQLRTQGTPLASKDFEDLRKFLRTHFEAEGTAPRSPKG